MNLSKLQESSLNTYLEEPEFLTHEKKEKLIKLAEDNKNERLFDEGGEVITNSKDVLHLYMYLYRKLEERGVENEEITHQVSQRLYNYSKLGWLNIADPNVLSFIKDISQDEDLQEQIEAEETPDWITTYKDYVELEHTIEERVTDLDNPVTQYHSYLTELYEDGKISETIYDETIDRLMNEITIYKGDNPIGRLISKELQKELNLEKILPTISLDHHFESADYK